MIVDTLREPVLRPDTARMPMNDERAANPGAVVTANVARLHELAWTPGRFMHAGWWAHLDLAAWREPYRWLPACRHAVDGAIALRRGFPVKALGISADPAQCRLIDLDSRLPALCTALGLIALDCDDYLMLKPYRQALMLAIGPRGCDQVLTLKGSRHGTSPATVPVERIAEAAMVAGVKRLGDELPACEVWRALLIRLPPVVSTNVVPRSLNRSTGGGALSMLFRLERFL